MTPRRKLLSIILLMGMLMHQPITLFAQKAVSDDYLAIKNLLETGQYVFHVQLAIPLTGNERLITEDYFVSVSKDSVMADLPYFGQVYAMPMNTNDIGTRFIAHDFDYKLKERKKGGWDISIVPKDTKDQNTLKFAVYKDGTIYLYITNNTRQSISYRGYISATRAIN